MIRLNRVTKHFGDKKLFTDFSMTVNRYEKILISSPSGTGKTTLIRLLMGFDIPDQGEITIDGQRLSPHNLRNIRSKIAYVSQDTDLMSMSVRQHLSEISSYRINRHLKDPVGSFIVLCPDYGLTPDILDEAIDRLSGGERQRVALIFALLLDRPIMILDEITSGLDQKLKSVIAEKVLSMNKTLIIVSHDQHWKKYDGIREVTLE